MDRLYAGAAALCLMSVTGAAPTLAQDGGFAALNGQWRGGGTLQHQNGVTERIRCDASYRGSSEHLRQTLRCASDQTQFALVANLSLNGREVIGDWSETTRNARGSVRGRFAPGALQALVDGPGFSANVSIRYAGNRQNVTIKSAGQEMTSLNMVLTRAGR